MMTSKLRMTLAAMAMATLTACAGTAKQESTAEYVEDTAITAEVKGRFVGDKEVSAMSVNVETFKGVVQLSGFADNEAEIARAEQIAREVKGVQSVRNDIALKTKP